MAKLRTIKHFLLTISLVFLSSSAEAESLIALKRLQKAYPDTIQAINSNYLVWKDGTRLPLRASFSFMEWFGSLVHYYGHSEKSTMREAMLDSNDEAFLKKMYGNSAAKVKSQLVTIYWMPKVFGKTYPLKVTTINGVDKKLALISAELEKLPPSYYKYVANPAGTFYWRKVAGQSYQSAHSFGIAIDINARYGNYWLWDFLKLKRPLSDLRHHKITYQNTVPLSIVKIFEKQGFFWGGHWYFYDTMHFEYRPERFIT